MIRRLLPKCAVLGAALSLSSPAFADDRDDSPQFRGPGGQGQVTSNIPTKWSEDSKAWAVPIPGKGWSSPVVYDGKVWLTTAVADKGKGASLRVLAFDRQSGKMLHDLELFAVEKAAKLHDRNSLATPTPIADKGRLYVSFGAHGIAAIDTGSGKVVWKNEQFPLDYETGAASSPIVYKDKLILPCDAADAQFALALSTSTGDVIWKMDRPEALKQATSSRRAFATPLVFNHDGKDQIVMPGSHCVYSYEPDTGKELWRVQYKGFSNVPRPLYAHGLVYVCTGFAPPEMWAIRPDGQGDVSKTHVVWKQRKNVPNIPSPVIVGDSFFMISDSGTASCLDAKTGDVKWSERLPGTYGASLLVKDKTIYAFADSGKTTLFEAGDTYKELGVNEIAATKVQATPAASGDAIFIRTESRLVKIGK